MWARVVMHGEFKLNMNSCLTLGQVRCRSADGRRYSAVRSGQQGTDTDRHGAPRAPRITHRGQRDMQIDSVLHCVQYRARQRDRQVNSAIAAVIVLA